MNGRGSRQQQLPGEPGFELVDAQLASSSSRLGVMTVLARRSNGRGDNTGSEVTRDILGGAVDGRLMPLSPRCHDTTGLPAIDASGNVIAYESCRDVSDDAVVIDPIAGPGSTQKVVGAGNGVRIAGKYLAWLDNYQPTGQLLFGHRYDIVVFDRVAGSVIYRIPASETDGGVHSFDIQDDGTLAVSYVTLNKARDTSIMRVAWASVASPQLHHVPLPASDAYEVALVGGKIGFLRGQGTLLNFGEVGTSDFAGHAHLVARNAEGLVGHRTFDFDGQRLAWWSYGCSAARINIARKSAHTIPRERHGCPLTFRQRPRVVGTHAVTFRVNCFGFASCSVRDVTLATKRGHGTIVARGRGRRARFTRAGRALLKGRRKLRVMMAATITDVVGRRERRGADVVIARN